MALKHLQEVITGAGLPADEVKKLMELADDDKEFKAETYTGTIRTNVATEVKNDPKFYEGLNKELLPKEFYKQLEQEQYGRAATIVRANILKTAGLKEDDFKDLGEDVKKLEVFGAAFAKKVSEGKVTDKEVQAALQEANKKLQELEASVPDLEKKYEAKYEAKVQAHQNSSNILATIAAVPGLKVPPTYVSKEVQDKLAAKYTLVNIKGTTELRQLGKPDLKVLVDKGTVELTLARAITELLTADGVVDPKAATKTTTQQKGTTTTTVEGDGKGAFKMPVNDKLQRRLDEEAKRAQA